MSIDMPEDVRSALEGRWGNLSRRITENLALDGYRQGLLSLAQVRRLLGLATRWEARQFLGSHGIPVFDFDPAELAVLQLTTELLTTRGVAASLFDQVHTALGAEATVEVLMLISRYAGLALMLNALDVDLDETARLPNIPQRTAES